MGRRARRRAHPEGDPSAGARPREDHGVGAHGEAPLSAGDPAHRRRAAPEEADPWARDPAVGLGLLEVAGEAGPAVVPPGDLVLQGVGLVAVARVLAHVVGPLEVEDHGPWALLVEHLWEEAHEVEGRAEDHLRVPEVVDRVEVLLEAAPHGEEGPAEEGPAEALRTGLSAGLPWAEALWVGGRVVELPVEELP